jgi:hypothetical protein
LPVGFIGGLARQHLGGFTRPPEMVKPREGRVVFKLPDLGINNTTAPGGSQKIVLTFKPDKFKFQGLFSEVVQNPISPPVRAGFRV